MPPAPEPSEIAALRAALAVTPENVLLRKLLAEALIKYNFHEAAVNEYREALRQAPRDSSAQLGLARAFQAAGMVSEAIVLVEALMEDGHATAPTHLLLARLLCERGELQQAARQVRRARELDPLIQDADLESRLEPFLTLLPDASKQESTPAFDPPRSFSSGENDDEVDEMGRVRAQAGDRPGDYQADVERPTTTFADVGGMEEVKEQIRMKIIHPLTHAEMFKAYGKKVGGGVLLYGPPGCGKTHLARATAGEVKASFISIGLHEVLDMWVGQSEKNLHQLFDQARRNRPSVMFVDEVDALAANRADLRHSATRNVINQFLAEMDGLETNNEGLLILAATNAPWHLDSAFRRPGRFDQIVFVPPPDEPARAAILRVLLRGKPADNVDFAAVAHKTEGFSGADLKGLVERTIEVKLTAAMKSGQLEPLSTRDLQSATKGIKPSTLDWFATAKNYALYANQGGHYDEVLAYLKIKR